MTEKRTGKRTKTHACDLISRQAAIDIERNATVDTNPSHFEAHQKFTQFMDDAEVSSFGRWQWSNGFNTALTAVGIDLKKLPSAQPEYNLTESCADCKEYDHERHCCPRWNKVIKRTVEDLESAHAWHECFEDDPDSFPDDDRNVLVSFSNFSLSIIGQWRVDDNGSGCWYLGDTDETFLSEGLFVDGWWELPIKPERS